MRPASHRSHRGQGLPQALLQCRGRASIAAKDSSEPARTLPLTTWGRPRVGARGLSNLPKKPPRSQPPSLPCWVRPLPLCQRC